MIGCLNCGKFIAMDCSSDPPEFCNYGCMFDYRDRGCVPKFNSEEREKNLQESYKLRRDKWLKTFKKKCHVRRK
jgi:hypothetical protein